MVNPQSCEWKHMSLARLTRAISVGVLASTMCGCTPPGQEDRRRDLELCYTEHQREWKRFACDITRENYMKAMGASADSIMRDSLGVSDSLLNVLQSTPD